MIRPLITLLLLATAPAAAAELDGIRFPDTIERDGVRLALNGVATRVYSIFRVKVYTAALYLERPTRDAAAIMASRGPKVVDVRYRHEVSRDDAVRAWNHVIRANCPAPACEVPVTALARFDTLLGEVADGDTMRLAFTPDTLAVETNGRPTGTVVDGQLSRLVLATWIGDAPTSEDVKRGLLGGR